MIDAEVASFLDMVEQQGCLELARLEELIARLELGESEVEALCEELATREIQLSERCDGVTAAKYRNSQLAASTGQDLRRWKISAQSTE